MRTRLVFATLPVVALLWLGIGTYLRQTHQAGLEGAEQDTRNMSHAFEENIRRTIEAIDTTIRAARVARAREGARFDLAAWERDSGLTRELTLQISLIDRNGDVIETNLDKMVGKRASVADREHFRLPRDTPGDALFISRPVLGRVSNRWSVQFVRKMFDAAGAFDGVIVGSLDPAFLSRFCTSLDIGNGALLLLGRDGIVRSGAPEAVAKLGDDLSESLVMTGASITTHGTVRTIGTRDGVERTFSWRGVEPYGLIVAVGVSTEDALIDYRRDLNAGIAMGIAVTVLSLIVSAALARNRRQVTQSREILRAAVENISQGLLVVDARRRVPVLNARAAELLELPRHLMRPAIEFDSLLEWQIEAGEFDGHDASAARMLAESGGIEGGTNTYQYTRRNGTVLEIRTKVLETGLAVRTLTDITAQQHAAHVLAEARDAAEAAARARSEFLAVMSHEIRTPLNGVIGVAGLLQGMDMGEAQRDYVRIIRQSGDHLLELINDILDFSRLDAGRMELEALDFDPDALMRGVVDMFLPQAMTKGLVLSATVADAVPAAVTGDPGRLRQILLNLVGNAIKFTDHGRVGLNLTHEARDDGRVRLVFAVADTGIGIVQDAIDRMFQEFTQADGSISRRFGGSGLGLTICRRLVELMGGSIGVESQPGVGSKFRFDVTLPIAVARADVGIRTVAGGNPDATAATPLYVLLAEDNATNRLVALRLLERLGHRADAVGNGAEAIAALQLVHYDLILMDVMMPEMDGLTATRHVRATEQPHARIPIVGLTAGSGAESLAACLNAGMDVVATKPVTLERLQLAIAQALDAARPQTPQPETNTSRLSELAAMLGPDAVAEIVQTFAEDTRTNVEVLRLAAVTSDVVTTRRTAHSVAGAARNVGAETLADQASMLEENGASMSQPAIADLIAMMQVELERVLKGLEQQRAQLSIAG